jgi:phage-related minor tail protein
MKEQQMSTTGDDSTATVLAAKSTTEEIEDVKARIAASLDKLEELQKQLDQEQEREHERYLGEERETRIEAELVSPMLRCAGC